jgi:hypothetical protein
MHHDCLGAAYPSAANPDAQWRCPPCARVAARTAHLGDILAREAAAEAAEAAADAAEDAAALATPAFGEDAFLTLFGEIHGAAYAPTLLELLRAALRAGGRARSRPAPRLIAAAGLSQRRAFGDVDVYLPWARTRRRSASGNEAARDAAAAKREADVADAVERAAAAAGARVSVTTQLASLPVAPPPVRRRERRSHRRPSAYRSCPAQRPSCSSSR